MGADQPRWYRIGNHKSRHSDAHGDGHSQGDSGSDQEQATDNPQSEVSTAGAGNRPVADCDGALVARSQVRVSGSTATLHGTLTNETTLDVHFSGMPPYVNTLETDGSRPVLLGDFNSPPREQPSCADWVMHPGASVPYQSLPVTVHAHDPRWEGAEWCTSSHSTTLDMRTFGTERLLPTIQLFS